ncbi:uncharacterized protein PAC_03538 [Phialocephala subalpina]|uniref:Zn(2)-C6 fungal-type domain-containing protein n=1 Tax=Phialocephala subalpina TaxID=576137 RepID=A0A1L7WLK4_9HELO|nr:uncharacterized protein PAC_03538 [Phialocephala subalpina]
MAALTAQNVELSVEAGIPRDRAQRACSNCAAQKLKCSGDQDGCQRCAQNELVCQYPETKRAPRQRAVNSRQVASPHSQRRRQHPVAGNDQSIPSQAHPQDQDSGSTTESQKGISTTPPQIRPPQTSGLSHGLRCTKDIIRRHADAYFEYVYPITTHGFLHQGTFFEKLDDDRAPVIIQKVIAVCASQFVASATQSARQITQWAQDVDAYIMNNLGSFSILNLEILVLWANHHHSSGNLGNTWMLLGLAARLAYCLQINVDSTIGSPSEIECRRRMMWSIRILDRLLAGTVEEFSLCSRFLDTLKLPCDEHLYLAEILLETDTLEGFNRSTQIPNIGGFAGLVGLIDIWSEILLFMKGVSQDSKVGNIIQQVSALRQKLSNFEQRLPSNLRFVNRNLYLHANSAQKMTFIMLQSWWLECHCDLYRFSLPGFRESVDLTSENAYFVGQCQQQALQSGLAQSNFWRSVVNMGHKLISDPTIVVLVHSNTRTLLACQKLRDQDGWLTNSTPGGTNDISTLLASNVSLLDELAKRMPRVTIAQREIQNLIHKNGFQGSSEAVLNAGLPLKRRHSRQDLLDAKRQQQERENRSQVSQGMAEQIESTQSLTDLNTMIPLFSVTETRLQESSIPGDDHTFNTAPENRFNGASALYVCTPTNLERSGLDPVELPDHNRQVKTRPTETGQRFGWQNTEFSLSHHLYGGEALADEQFLGLYEGDIFGGSLGCSVPFETATQDDMLTAANFAVDKGQQNSHGFF